MFFAVNKVSLCHPGTVDFDFFFIVISAQVDASP